MPRGKNIFDKLGNLIPGYNGYEQRAGRRNCDKILRLEISSKIDSVNNNIREDVKLFLKKNKITSSLEHFEDIQRKINTLSDRVKYAPYGESSFFASEEIKEEELDEIYLKDLKIMQIVNDFSSNYSFDGCEKFILTLDKLITVRFNFIRDI